MMLPALLTILPLMTATDSKPVEPIKVEKTDWAWWRGPNHDGSIETGAVTTEWSESENVVWKAKVPGRGHGSAIIVGDQVLIAGADKGRGVQSVVCFDFATGKQAWESIVHQGGIYKGGNKKASQASSTPACDGERIYASFLNKGAIHTSAISRKGDVLWTTKISDYIVHQGYGASPLLFEDLVIVSADNKGGGKVAALRRSSGDIVWEHKRPKKPNYPSPVIYELFGKKQLILTGCDLVTSLDPRTGKEHWQVKGATTECVTTSVTDGTQSSPAAVIQPITCLPCAPMVPARRPGKSPHVSTCRQCSSKKAICIRFLMLVSQVVASVRTGPKCGSIALEEHTAVRP